MPRRSILTDRQRAALFDLPTDDASMLRHYTLAGDNYLDEHRRRPDQRSKAWPYPWAAAIAARDNLSPPRSHQRRKIRCPGRETPRHRQINRLQGDQEQQPTINVR